MRSPKDMDIVQIDGNNSCHKRCSNCTRAIAHQSAKWELSPNQLLEAIRSMSGWHQEGRVLGLIGGEITLHSKMGELCQLLRETWNPEKKVWLGGAPIADMNAFANKRLFDRTSGRGLWTSLGAGFYRNMEQIFQTFDHWNTNTHESGGLHQAMFITRSEYQVKTGMGNAEWEANRDRCWVQNMWSATINDKGAYPCEVMGVLDRLYFNGSHAWPVEKGWWKRKPEDFGSMLELCNYCSLAQPGPGTLDTKETDVLCQISLEKLKQAGSPAVKKGKYTMAYDPISCQEEDCQNPAKWKITDDSLSSGSRNHKWLACDSCARSYLGGKEPREGSPLGDEVFLERITTSGRQVETNDSYMASDVRVGPEGEASVRPRKLSCVTVCVGYADKLKLTLPHNTGLIAQYNTHPKLVDEMIVVTTEEDVETRKICDYHGVQCVVSNSCYDDNAAFNKGKMLNAGLAALERPDWILLSDADVLLHPKTLEFVKGHVLNPGCLYGTHRYDSTTIERLYGEPRHDLSAVEKERPEPTGINAEANGFFQLFSPKASALSDRAWPNLMPETFCSAGGIDSWLLAQFQDVIGCKTAIIPEIPVIHINHGDFAKNWNGLAACQVQGCTRPAKWIATDYSYEPTDQRYHKFPICQPCADVFLKAKSHATPGTYFLDPITSPGKWVQLGMLTLSGWQRLLDPAPAYSRLRLTDTLHGHQAEVQVKQGEQIPENLFRWDEQGIVFCGKPIGHNHVHVACLAE